MGSRAESAIRSDRIDLGFVRLLAARADEIFDGLGSFIALPLLEFTDPVGDSVYHVASGLAGRF